MKDWNLKHLSENPFSETVHLVLRLLTGQKLEIKLINLLVINTKNFVFLTKFFERNLKSGIVFCSFFPFKMIKTTLKNENFIFLVPKFHSLGNFNVLELIYPF